MSTMQDHGIPFSQAAHITPLHPHEYQAHIHPDYSYGPAAHGGFLNALLWRAIATHFNTTLAKYNQHDIVTLHVEFLRPATSGEVRIHVEDVRLGKASSTVHARLLQGGKARVAGYATVTNRGLNKGLTVATNYTLTPPPPRFHPAQVLTNQDPNWIQYHVPYRLDSLSRTLSNVIFAVPKQLPANSDPTIFDLWLTLTNPAESWTNDKLGYAVDQFGAPPSENYFPPNGPNNVTSIAAIAQQRITAAEEGRAARDLPHITWTAPRFYSTVCLSLEVKERLAEEGEGVKWLFLRCQTKDIRDGRLDVSVEVWRGVGGEEGDGDGNAMRMRLVAVSQQAWMVVEMDRSLISRLGGRDDIKRLGESKM